MENTHEGVSLLVKLQAQSLVTLLKVTRLHECFSRFLNCTKWYQIAQRAHMIDCVGVFIRVAGKFQIPFGFTSSPFILTRFDTMHKK